MKCIKITLMLMLFAVNVTAISEAKVLRVREGQHLLIAPAEFIPLTNQLADFYYAEFGIQRTIVDQQVIFDHMSGGIPDAEAIRQYLIQFFDDPSVWMESSVLLVGSGTNEWGIPDEKNRIMVYDFSDDNFVDLDGDDIPDIPIGRLPAQNLIQLELIIDRNIQYIQEPVLGWWKNRVLLVADDEHKSGILEGLTYYSGMNHTARAQDVVEVLNDEVWVDKVLGIEYEMNANGNKPEAAQDIIDRINEGRLVWYYIGHGNEDVLGDEEYFRVSTQLQLLQNAEYLPLFIAASPSVGRFDSIDYDCVAEIFLTYQNGGSIASVAATRACSPTPNTTLIKRLLENIINDDDYLGAGLLDAKLNSGANINNSKLFNLLGDPLLFVNPPESDEQLFINGNPEILYFGDEVQVTGQVSAGNLDIAVIKAFESEYDMFYTNSLVIGSDTLTYSVDYTKFGYPYFEDETTIFSNSYDFYFTILDIIQTGEYARIISYIYGAESDYVQFIYPITISDGTHSPDLPIIPDKLIMFNYPNPFNPSTTISFALPQESEIELTIFNLKGQKVKCLTKGDFGAGNHSYVWDGKDNSGKSVSGGIYFYQLKTESETVFKKMVLLK